MSRRLAAHASPAATAPAATASAVGGVGLGALAAAFGDLGGVLPGFHFEGVEARALAGEAGAWPPAALVEPLNEPACLAAAEAEEHEPACFSPPADEQRAAPAAARSDFDEPEAESRAEEARLGLAGGMGGAFGSCPLREGEGGAAEDEAGDEAAAWGAAAAGGDGGGGVTLRAAGGKVGLFGEFFSGASCVARPSAEGVGALGLFGGGEWLGGKGERGGAAGLFARSLAADAAVACEGGRGACEP